MDALEDRVKQLKRDLYTMDVAATVRFEVLCELITRCMVQLSPVTDKFAALLMTIAQNDTEVETYIRKWSKVHGSKTNLKALSPSSDIPEKAAIHEVVRNLASRYNNTLTPAIVEMDSAITNVTRIVTSLEEDNKARHDEQATLNEKLDLVEQYIKYVGQDVSAVGTRLQTTVEARLVQVDKKLQTLFNKNTPCSEIPRRKFQTCRARADCLYEKGKGCRDADATRDS